MRPFRMTFETCGAARDPEHAAELWEQAAEALKALGLVVELGVTELMADGDVLPDSPLAAALAG